MPKVIKPRWKKIVRKCGRVDMQLRWFADGKEYTEVAGWVSGGTDQSKRIRGGGRALERLIQEKYDELNGTNGKQRLPPNHNSRGRTTLPELIEWFERASASRWASARSRSTRSWSRT